MYKEYSPCNLLSPFIDKYWIYKGQPKYGARVSIPPYGCTDFVFTLGEMFTDINSNLQMQPYHSYFVGPMNKHTELMAFTENIHVVGIRFLPSALYRFMGLPLNELVNHKCKAEDLTKLFNDSFIERLYALHDSHSLVAVIDEFLIRHLNKHNLKTDSNILLAVNKINEGKGMLSVQLLASETCLSQRHFERKFKMYTGYSPKEYSRIVKFWNAIDLLRNTPYENLLSTAVSAGYYDVPHLSREIKRLSGNTPSSFLMLPPKTDTRIYLES